MKYLYTVEIDRPEFFRSFFPYYAFTWMVQFDNNYSGLIYSGWSPSGIGLDVNEAAINSVSAGQKIYRPVYSLHDVIGNSSTYYFDTTNRILYVHFNGDLSPRAFSDVSVKINLIFGTYKTNYANFNGILQSQQYYPRLRSVYNVSTSLDDLFNNKTKFESNKVSIANADYRFVNYNIGRNLTQKKFGALARIKNYTGDNIDSIDYANDFETIYQGRLAQIDEGSTLEISLTDLRKQFDKKIPEKTFDLIGNNYGESGEDEDPVVPLIYGNCKKIPCFCLNKEADASLIDTFDFLLCDNFREIDTTEIGDFYINNKKIGSFQTLSDCTIVQVNNAYVLQIDKDYFAKLEAAGPDSGTLDDTVSYENMDKFSINVQGYTLGTAFSSGFGLQIIRYILQDFYSYDFDDVYWDNGIEWLGQTTSSYHIGLHIAEPEAIYKVFEKIQTDCLGYLQITPNLKVKWVDNDDRTIQHHINSWEFIPENYVPVIKQDPEEVLAKYRIGYDKEWNQDEKYQFKIYDDNLNAALENYNTRQEKDFKTLLTDTDDVDDYADKISFYTGNSKDTVEIVIQLDADTINLRSGHWVTCDMNLPNKDILGLTKCQIVKTKMNIEKMQMQLTLRIMDLAEYLIDSNGNYLIDHDNNKLYEWRA